MINKAVLLNNLPVNIEPVRVMRELRIPHKKELSELDEKPLADGIAKAIEIGYSLIQGKGIYKTFMLDEAMRNCGLFEGKSMEKLLATSERVTLLACTIGNALEDECDRLKENDEATLAFLLDAVGGWMADYMADQTDDVIVREINRAGFGRTFRFAPGYGDFALSHQRQLLGLVEAERIGITLSETSIMHPRKSVSTVISLSVNKE